MKLAIIGKGYTAIQCPFNKDTIVWTVNDTFLQWPFKKLDAVFFFDKHFIGDWMPVKEKLPISVYHEDYVSPTGVHRKGELVQITPQLLDSLGVPIVSFHMSPEIKNHRPFPYEAVINFFRVEFFVNSICWMLALAIMEGFEEINLYGIDLLTDKEIYSNEKGCMEFWIGCARARGIKVNISKGSTMCPRHLYGLDHQYQ